MSVLVAALTATQILIAAPLDTVGTTRREAISHFGKPSGVGTDVVGAPGEHAAADRVVTIDFAKTRVRLYESSSDASSQLIYVATVDERFATRSAVRVGVDRGAVLRELGGPMYEDEDQLLYASERADDPAKSDRVRIVLENDRVVGLEWTFAR
jgi:hypothetical protein